MTFSYLDRKRMTTVSSLGMETLVELNRNGLFPSPGQADDLFWKKVDFIATQTNLSEKPPGLLSPFDVNPSWVPIATDNKGLQFWEGAVLWLEQTDAGFVMPKIQISNRVQRFYTRDELIAHEMVHAVRSDFAEEQFEEILAYATSPKAWRRWLGPFFRNPSEASIFLWALLLTIGVQAFEIATEWTSGWLLFPWLPLLLISAGYVRLHRGHRLFQRCLKNLETAMRHPERS